MKYYRYLLLILVTLCCPTAKAATYYVDASNGNDSFSGTTVSISTTDGPWQSIAKVNAALLQPGDNVLFSCGQTWYDTLNPVNNGTAAAKIYFGSYPSQCTTKPKISGLQSPLANNWQPYQGNIWKTTFPQNLIINRSLSTSVDGWSRWPSDASLTFNNTCPLSVSSCMNFLAGPSSNALAVSNSFPVIGGQKYNVTVSFYAPSGTSITLIVRENGNTYSPLGLVKTGIMGNDQWQDVSVEFTATRTLSNARLDTEILKTQQIFVRYANVQRSGVQPQPTTVMFNGTPVTIAHHPNAGFDPARPDSIFLRTTAASPTIQDTTGRAVSAQLIAPDLQLPIGGSVNSGTKLILRPLDWSTKAYTVTAANTNVLSITPNTPYPLSQAGWGFYFYDDLWMLDSPGEWFFDNTSQTLYLWTPTNKNPGALVSVATIDTAINLNARSNITVENLEIDGASTGIDITKSTNIALRYLNIHNIAARAINATQSVAPTVASNRIVRVGLSAIYSNNSTNALIDNNEQSEIGLSLDISGKRISLPMTTEPAIVGGSGSIIQYNSISNSGDNGIMPGQDNIIESNVIQRSCFTQNDCGAIYLPTASLRTVILNNLILEVLGNIDGTPAGYAKNVGGIYLDDGVAGISVSGNTVQGATNSIKIHNGGNHTISNNILYGSDNELIFQQENSLAHGGISGNKITGNQLYPTTQNFAINSTSTFSDVVKFATYDTNHYSLIQSPIIVTERGPGFSRDYKLMDWQSATSSGIARNNDLNGDTPAPLTSFAQGINGLNFMTNGDFSNGINAWGSWNSVAPYSSKILEGCLPVSVNCIHVIAGASETLINSPKFAITQGKLYRMTFDLKSTVNTGFLYPVVRLAGPSYAGVAKTQPSRFTISDQWKRHSFVFEASVTAADPTQPNQGTRFDIAGIPAGLNVWMANVEIAPFDPGISGSTKSDMLVNITDMQKTIDCPTRLSNPDLCSSYVDFPEAIATTWPISVPPRSGKIVFTQNMTLLDSDGDGVADSQDKCPSTVKGLEVNTKGCSLTD